MTAFTDTEDEGRKRAKASRRVACQVNRDSFIQVVLTDHSLSRFQERVRPALAGPQLVQDFGRTLSGFGKVTTRPPAWQEARAKQKADLYVVIEEEFVIPLSFHKGVFYAKTVLTRAGISEKAREGRNRRGQQKRQRRNARRRGH
jgi:hypothetical protein